MMFKMGLVALTLVFFSSCQKPPAPPKKISFQHYFSGSLSGGLDDLVKAFNKKNPEILLTAKAVDHETFKSNFKQIVRSSDPPEFLSYWAGAKTAAVAGELADLSEIWERSGLGKVFSTEITASAVTVKGRRVLIPLTQHYVGFFYSQKVFRDLGLTEPTNYDQFLQICQTIKRSGRAPLALGSKDLWPAQFWFDYFLLRTGGMEFREELLKGEKKYTDEKVKQALSLWKDLLDKGYFNSKPSEKTWDTEAALSVLKGEAGMTLMGTWLIGFFEAPEQRTLSKGYGFFSFPIIDPQIPQAALGPVDGVVVPATVRNWQEIQKVIQYLADPEVQKAMSQGSGALAPCLKVPDTFYTPLQNKIRRDIAVAKSWSFNYDLAADPAVSPLGLAFFKDFIDNPQRLEPLLEDLEKGAKEVNKGL